MPTTPTGIVLKSDLTNIANAIRTKTNTLDTMTPSQMFTKINTINGVKCIMLNQYQYDNISPLDLDDAIYLISLNMINYDPNDGYESGIVLYYDNYGNYAWQQRSDCATSGYIPVVPGVSYTYSHIESWTTGHYQMALCYYATKGGSPSNGTRCPTGFTNANGTWTFTAPAGVAYVRIPLGKSSIPPEGTSLMVQNN